MQFYDPSSFFDRDQAFTDGILWGENERRKGNPVLSTWRGSSHAVAVGRLFLSGSNLAMYQKRLSFDFRKNRQLPLV